MKHLFGNMFIGSALVALAAVTLAGCGGGATGSTGITRPRLERSLERAYANRYVALTKIQGHSGVTPATLDAHAVCDKGGPTVADDGPGGDWICQVAYVDPNVINPDGSAKVELNVHSNDCYTAAGPSKLVGPLNLVDVEGMPVVNPAFEFDACFDPASNGEADGTLLIVNATPLPGLVQAETRITLPTGLVSTDEHRRMPLALQCADGSEACTGTVDVAVQGTRAGSVPYTVPAGTTRTVKATLPPAQVRDGGIINLTLHEEDVPPASR